MKGRDNLSNSLQSLLLLFNQALGARWGVRVRVRGNGDLGRVVQAFKAKFYQARKQSPAYANLTLLSTRDPEVFMILKGDETNGEGRLESDSLED